MPQTINSVVILVEIVSNMEPHIIVSCLTGGQNSDGKRRRNDPDPRVIKHCQRAQLLLLKI